MRITASVLDKQVRVQRKVAGEGFGSAGKDAWVAVGPNDGKAFAQVQDILPSREADRGDGFGSATRRARVRMRYRADITEAMRLVMGGRVMQITTMPVEIGRRDGIEFMVEDYSPAGNPA